MSVTLAARAVPGPRKDPAVAASLARRRRRADAIAGTLGLAATLLGLAALASVLLTLTFRGVAAMRLGVFAEATAAPGAAGGLLDAIAGSVIQVLLGAGIGAPIGILVGTYLAEYARASALGDAVRFVSDILLSAPAILVGLFVHTVLVLPMGGFSGWAGVAALAVIAIPVVARTTEEMLARIPDRLREAATSLGAPKWRMVVFVGWRSARAGILAGVLLAAARLGGEAAALLFTSGGNHGWSTDLSQPMASLPVTVYAFAASAIEDRVALAWAGALLITLAVLAPDILARRLLRARR